MNRPAMPRNTMNRRKILPALAGAAALALSACGSGGESAGERPPLADAAIGGEFTLTGKDGKPVQYSDFDGKYRIVYFGYTFCPDVCPVDVQNFMAGYRMFVRDKPELAARIQPIFITVDPERDTPQVVGQFAANFGPELIGLTGTPAQVAEAAKKFATYYAKREEEGGAKDAYLMDHLRATYLMGPDGKPLALLPSDEGAKAVAAELAKWVR